MNLSDFTKRAVTLLLAGAVACSSAVGTALAEDPVEPQPQPSVSADQQPSQSPAEQVEVERGAEVAGFVIEDAAEGVVITGPGSIDLSSGALTIPNTLDGKPVVGIADGAFRGKGLTSLEFENGSALQSIGAGAFQGNQLAGELTIPAATIGDNAFAQNQLTGVTLNGTIVVGADAFRDNAISTVTFAPPAGQSLALGDRAFINNRLAGELDLTKVGNVGLEAFSTNAIRTVTPGAATNLGDQVFAGNGSWVEIKTGAGAVPQRGLETKAYPSGHGQVVDPVKVVVRYLDQDGKPIAPDETLGADLSDGQAYQRGQQATITPRNIQGYQLQTPTITFTPDRDGYVIEAKYQLDDQRPTITFPSNGISLANGEAATPERLKRGVTAKAADGTDLTSQIIVDSSSVESDAPGIYNVVYSVRDANGNERVETAPVAVGVNWEEYEFGGGWQIKDFVYKDAQVTGFSSSGRAKLNSGKTDLWIPPINSAGQPVTAIGAFAFDSTSITAISDWGNVEIIRDQAFRSSQLKKVPDTWQQVKVIENFSFYGTRLESVPDSWGSVAQIGAQAFQSAKIVAVPASWGNITEIGNLAFSGNKITELPSSWGNVETLGSSAFRDNRIVALPGSWGNLTEIRAGTFANNSLTRVPDSWESITAIGQDAFNNNDLTRIPDSWGEVKTLGRTAFKDNKLTRLPESWGEISELPYGVFDNNEVTSLPSSWGNITTIGSVAFSQNALTSLPDSWGRVSNIGSHAFTSNQLAALPSSWGSVTLIDNGAFKGNRITVLPETWGEVQRVGVDAFASNRLQSLPGSWGKITRIEGRAFQNNLITSLPDSWGNVTAIASNAFDNNKIAALPDSWGNVSTLGSGAFAQNSLPLGMVFQMPAENLKKSFTDGLTSMPRPLTIYTHDGTTPAGLVVPSGVRVNPVKVVVNLVDEEGNPVGAGSLTQEGRMNSPFSYQPPHIFGYEAAQEVTANLSGDRTQEVTVVYRKVPNAELDAQARVELKLNNSEPYLIGRDMTGSVRIDRTGYDSNTLKNVRVQLSLDPNVYDLDKFDITTTGLGIDRNSIKREGSTFSFVLPSLASGQVIEIPIRTRFIEGPTAANKQYPIFATLLSEDGKLIAGSQNEAFSGYYLMPSETVKTLQAAGDGSVSEYDQAEATTPDAPATFVADDEPGETVRNTLAYNVVVDGLHRDVADYTISVPLPQYQLHPDSVHWRPDQTTRMAQFDPAKNPGWQLSADGKSVIYTGNNADTRTPISQTLNLGFPGALENSPIDLRASTVMIPSEQGNQEPDMVTSGGVQNFFAKRKPPKGRLLYKFASGNHGGSPNYFYDTAKERAGQFPWVLSYDTPRTMTGVVFRDWGLDERMYYDTVRLPDNLGDVTVKVLDARGVAVEQVEVARNEPRQVTFERGKVLNAVELRIELANPLPAGSSGDITITSRLKAPNTALYQGGVLENNIFKNSSTLEADGQALESSEAQKKVEPQRQRLQAVKTGAGISEDGNAVTDLITGDSINYTVGFRTDAAFGETITDIVVLDLLPIGVDIEKVSMGAEFSRLPGARYEVVENYRNSGHTAVIFHASAASVDQIVPGSAVTAGRVTVKTNLAVPDGRIENDVFVKAINTELANEVVDQRLGGDKWSKAAVESSYQPANAMEQTKQIRAYDQNDVPGIWSSSVTTLPGAKLDYRLRLTNRTERARTGIVAYDVFPHVGDRGIPSLRQSAFANTYDPTRVPTLPAGYVISYYNGDSWPTYDGSDQEATEAALSALPWSSQPSVNTKAVRIVQSADAAPLRSEPVEFVLPMTANAERLDAYGNPPADLIGKSAYNTFFYRDNQLPELLEGNRVENKLRERPISIEFVKISERNNRPLAGASFALQNTNGETIAYAASDSNGIVRFENVQVRAGFRVVETAAPKGHLLNAQPRIITSEDIAAGYAKDPAKIELGQVSNAPEPPAPVYGEVEFLKWDIENKPLPGSRFELTSRDNSLVYSAAADSNGKVIFANVRPGSYRLSEVQPVGSLQPINTIWSVNVSANKTTRPGKTVNGTPNVIVNDKVAIPLVKLGVTDDRLRDANGNSRRFGDFQSMDGKRLSGFTFQVLDDSTGAVVSKVSQSASSTTTPVIANLNPGVVYRLKETQAPSNYETVPDFEMRFKVGTRGEIMAPDGTPFPVQSAIYVPNRQQTKASTVTVAKQSPEGVNLAGAAFVLQRFESDDWVPVGDPVVTEADGVAAFAGLAEGRYRVVETQNPLGYLGRFVSNEFIVQRTKAATFTFTAVNARIQPTVAKVEYLGRGLPDHQTALQMRDANPGAVVELQKGSWQVVRYLPGATFQVREDDANGALVQEVTTGADGKAAITADLEATRNYALVETKVPDGYVASSYPVTFNPTTALALAGSNARGKFTVYVGNSPVTGRIVVSKTDESNSQPLLKQQATFSAQRVAAVTDGSVADADIVINEVRYRPQDKPLTKQTTQSGGLATFDKLPYGTYIVRETKAAAGYLLDEAPVVVELDADNASYTHVFANKPVTPELTVTKFINDQDANSRLNAAWLQPGADSMNVKIVVENTGNTVVDRVQVTDVIAGTDDQYVNDALVGATFTVTDPDGSVVSEAVNGEIGLQPGGRAEVSVTVASPAVSAMHQDTATATGHYGDQLVSDDDPAHAYRLPAPLPLPMSGDKPWLLALLGVGVIALALSVLLSMRSRRRDA